MPFHLNVAEATLAKQEGLTVELLEYWHNLREGFEIGWGKARMWENESNGRHRKHNESVHTNKKQ
jgi:hypothetical protein